MKKIFAAIILLLLFFTHNLNAQSTKLSIKKSWIVAKPQVAGAVQINPETGEEGNAISHQLFVYLMLKNGTKPVYQNANFNQQKSTVLVENKGTKVQLDSQKEGKHTNTLRADKGYTIWRITILDLVQDNISKDKTVKIILTDAKNTNRTFVQKPILLSTSFGE